MKRSSSLPMEVVEPHTIYMKLDTSKASNDRVYYFTDGVNKLSENCTFKQSVEKCRFLQSIGIKVVDRSC